jgi:hypothetical protein
MNRAALFLLLVCSAVLLSCSLLPGPMDVKCDSKDVREFASPDGRRKAVEIHSTCEGNTYHSTIEIAAGRDRATAMHASPHQYPQPPSWPDLKVEWKSPTELWITYPANVDAQCISSPANVAVHCLDGSIAR